MEKVIALSLFLISFSAVSVYAFNNSMSNPASVGAVIQLNSSRIATNSDENNNVYLQKSTLQSNLLAQDDESNNTDTNSSDD